uniref:Histone acetyltransferase type B catalytic subunit n=1 Tax=Ceriodaphnia reticulata TaxID=302197 RepID=A0A4Y7LZS8_9CRUS|nr:EOG090X06NC [Ceriodaphnia reticulata]SVE72949.1 EOG090X06NC [Ceriodaphnia reticulata]
MEGSYKKNILQSFIIDSNEALNFKLVREPTDVENDETTFKPEMSHQIFGENESIFGYQNLEVNLYYTAGKLNTYLGMKYTKQVDPKQFEGATADDVMGAISPKLPPGFMTNLDDFLVSLNKEQSFKPPGELLSTYTAKQGSVEKSFEMYSCKIEEPGFRSYHERLQTFLLWYVDAASFIDVDDDRWRFYLIFEKYPCEGGHRYAICGYATVYLYFAYPNKTRPRISQFLVLPPFQRLGLGAELLNVIYRSFLKDSNILDITVEDPSDEFVRIRDFVDAKNCQKLASFSKDKLQQGFNAEMVEEAQRELKINKKQARRVYEILRFQATNIANSEEYRGYRLDVKRRLNIPYQKEAADYKKLEKALNPEELRSTLSTSTKEQRIENLEKQYQILENEYRNVFKRISLQIMESERGLKLWLDMFHRFGIALLRGVPTTQGKIIEVVKRFAYVKETSYGVTFDVVAEPDPEHLAFTGAHLHHHTDMNYREKSPGMQLLHCLKSTDLKGVGGDPGGMSFFADGFRAAKWLKENEAAAFHILAATPVQFQINVNGMKFSQTWPIICTDNDGAVTEIHYNNRTMGPLQAPSHLVTPFYHAYHVCTIDQ